MQSHRQLPMNCLRSWRNRAQGITAAVVLVAVLAFVRLTLLAAPAQAARPAADGQLATSWRLAIQAGLL